MKNFFKIILGVIVAAVIGGYIYWQYNKKKIVRESIEKAIVNKSDSLYYIHYDSSRIDELTGSASFYNVVLQSDSAQKAMLNSTDSLPNAIYNIRVKQVSAIGIDIPGLLQKQNVAAKKILLLQPVIQIINTGADNPKPFTMNDTLELYQKILGKFKSIQTDTIQVTNATVLITNKAGKPQTTLENINITLSNFLVDSTKDYQNIISYFIKDVRATVENIQLPASEKGSRINLEKVDYNAAKRSLRVGSIKEYQLNNMNPSIDLKNIHISELNTDAFIIQQRLKAGLISCDGGLVTIYTKKSEGKSKDGDQSLELSTDIIDQAQIAGIKLGRTKVIIADKAHPEKPPFILNNVIFNLTKMLKINEGSSINNIVNNAEWELSADGFILSTKSKLYKMSVGDFTINTASSIVKASNFLIKPLLTEAQFVQQSKFQGDQYNLTVNDITLKGVNIKRLISRKELEMENASFQPIIKIFNDRTLPPGGASKLGKYPHQSLLKLPFPVYIHTVKIINGSVSYRERALKSKMIGNVLFENINAELQNITNLPDRIKVNPLLKLNATAKFLGVGKLSTEWQFPLNANNGAFRIEGRMGSMNAKTLNSIIEPLAMASVEEGIIDDVKFAIDGTDNKAVGNISFLYHDLKMDLLKKGADSALKKKGMLSALVNVVVKNANSNPAKTQQVSYDRDITKSFFNLVWKTIFTGAKKTAM